VGEVHKVENGNVYWYGQLVMTYLEEKIINNERHIWFKAVKPVENIEIKVTFKIDENT
jgi:hypothetical protein